MWATATSADGIVFHQGTGNGLSPFFSPLTWKSCGIYFLRINSTVNSKLPMLVKGKNNTDGYEGCFKNPL